MDDIKRLTRREEREEIIKTLYQMDIQNEYLFNETDYDFINESLSNIVDNVEEIDSIISKNLTNWKLSRLSFVDRAIIRFATYELLLTNTPAEIIINEALNLTRKYSDEGDNKMVGFTNKVLDNITKFLKK
jgi:N utilization substance protein B